MGECTAIILSHSQKGLYNTIDPGILGNGISKNSGHGIKMTRIPGLQEKKTLSGRLNLARKNRRSLFAASAHPAWMLRGILSRETNLKSGIQFWALSKPRAGDSISAIGSLLPAISMRHGDGPIQPRPKNSSQHGRDLCP